ncbi:MAG: hypothetical protein IT582_01545, partial [Opitutaceae bacterium]|nr:hypothetical protein [Opitutaceae bacterium]
MCINGKKKAGRRAHFLKVSNKRGENVFFARGAVKHPALDRQINELRQRPLNCDAPVQQALRGTLAKWHRCTGNFPARGRDIAGQITRPPMPPQSGKIAVLPGGQQWQKGVAHQSIQSRATNRTTADPDRDLLPDHG